MENKKWKETFIICGSVIEDYFHKQVVYATREAKELSYYFVDDYSIRDNNKMEY